jgi:ribosomal protein S18 acetylase RimI-like enzyme
MKIYKKHNGTRFHPAHKTILLKPEDYKRYQKVLLEAGYKSWVKGKPKKVMAEYIPATWMGVEKNGRLVGVCSAEFGPVKVVRACFSARIAALAVSPDWRGKGVGTSLVSEVVDALYILGYKHIYVAVQSDNKDAVRVYEKVGFEPINA